MHAHAAMPLMLCLGVGALAGLLWALYRARLRQVAREFERTLDARVAERTRIARDLHDTLLGSFNGLLLHLEAAAILFQTRPAETISWKRSVGSPGRFPRSGHDQNPARAVSFSRSLSAS
jgi:signal transduction histidine kinase